MGTNSSGDSRLRGNSERRKVIEQALRKVRAQNEKDDNSLVW